MDYNTIAEQYHKAALAHLSGERLEEHTVEFPGIIDPVGWKVLDIGCGSGIQCHYLAKRFPQIKQIYGIDTSGQFIAIAERTMQSDRVTFAVADMHTLPFENNTFDFINSRHAIHYSSNLKVVFREIERVAKPGCSIFLLVVNPIYELMCRPSKSYAKQEEVIFPLQWPGMNVRHTTHTIEEYINGILHAGLELVNIEDRYSDRSSDGTYYVPSALILRARKRT
jgi:ubiquinone/menaquinone biosynthesis C-methylase UbiE